MAGKDVSFKISAKDEASGTLNKVAGSVNSFGKETKEALKPLDNLNKSFSSITKAFTPLTVGITAAVAGLKKLSDAISVCTTEWAKDELAMKRIDFAGTINKQLAGTTKELKDLANSIESMTSGWVGAGDVMDAMSSMLYDKTTPQIKEIILAATDLSAAMGTDLNTAVTQLNNTFSGTLGQLGKMFPELKNLSKEELEAGKAIDIVADKVSGAGAAFAETTEGIKKAAEESANSLKSALGEAFSYLTAPMTQFFTKLRNNLANLISNANEVKRAMRAIETDDAQTRYDSAAVLQQNAKTLRDQLESTLRNEAAVNGLTDPRAIINMIFSNPDYQALDAEITQYGAIMGEALKELQELNNNGYIEVELTDTATQNVAESVAESVAGGLATGLVAAFGGVSGAWLSQQQYGGVTGMSLGLPELTGNYNAADYTTAPSKIESFFSDSIIPAFSEFIMSLSSVTALLEPVGTILEAVFGILGPAINSVLSPLVGFLQIVGQTVGNMLIPVLDVITPIIKLIGEALVWVYNKIIMPVANAFITLFNMVYNAIASVVNGILSIYNTIVGWFGGSKKSLVSYKSLDSGYMQEIDTGALSQAGMSYMGSTGSASYTAARDITVNIVYERSYVNGDAEDIAINLRNEMRRIEALGL